MTPGDTQDEPAAPPNAHPQSPETAAYLSQASRQIQLGPHQALFVQGDPLDCVYLVQEGSVRLTVVAPGGMSRAVGEVGPGDAVGQLGIVVGRRIDRPGTRWATAAGGERGAGVVRIDGGDLGELMAGDPWLRDLVRVSTQRRLDAMRRELGGLFGKLPAEVWLELQKVLDLILVHGGDVLMREGDEGDAVYAIVTGMLAVQKGPSDLRIAVLGPGQPVGETALLSGERRAATVVAIRDTLVLRLSSEDFQRVVKEHPEAAFPLLKTLARRMVDGPSVTPGGARAIAVVPLDSSPMVLECARALGNAVSDSGRVLLASDVDDQFGPGTARGRGGSVNTQAVLGWMSQQEQLRGKLAMLADPRDTAWTRRCLRQSDRVLLVARADQYTEPGEIERVLVSGELGAGAGPAALVLLHPADASYPRGTARWLDSRPGAAHFHVRQGHARDLARLVRFVTGRPHGLVLGGGGARGFAHIGLLRALEELGLPIDIVCGTSMGAVVAAALAMELSPDDTADKLRALMITSGIKRALTVPFTALLRTGRIDRIAEEIAQGLDIEDLWRPFFAVSANLSRYDLVEHDRGLLWRALRASCAIPALVPPALERGDVLVDGAVLDNLPVVPMSRRCGGHIVACDVASVATMRADPELTAAPSGGRLLLQRLLPKSRRRHVPGITSIITHSLVCSSVIQRRHSLELADLVLQPHTEHIGLLQFDRHEELEAIGYQATMERAEELVALFGV